MKNLYWIDNSEPDKTYPDETIGAFTHTTLGYLRVGVLVPDTLPQALADAWSAYKSQPMSEGLVAFCAAFDDVADLLDALTEKER